eukprot:4507710-Pyramimonas_sp.AAC.1
MVPDGVLRVFEDRVADSAFVVQCDSRYDSRAAVTRCLRVYLMCDKAVHRGELLGAALEAAHEHKLIL